MAIFAAHESGCGIFASTAGCNQENKSTISAAKNLTTSISFVCRAKSADERFPCFSEEIKHDILYSKLACFHVAVAPFDITESVCGSSSSLQSRFPQSFSPRAVCYSLKMFVIL